ncbi:MAG TPA: TRM11 family methyltransferase [Thermoplasmata archaeon]|nr:TRM11 family methyltransferase [Thermoplasmata archaeon]
MKLLLELSMECESLARSEALSIGRTIGSRSDAVLVDEGILVIDTDADPIAFVERMALCHSASEYMCSCNPEDVQEFSSAIDVPGPVRVHATRIGTAHEHVDLAELNSSVGAVLGDAVGVDIHNPCSEVRIVFSDKVHIGRLIGSVDRAAYERRKTKNLPFNHPISLHPKFARCIVNLVEVRPGKRILDPFCGTGAIVTEAALAGAEAIGSDVSEKMVDGARSNMTSVGVKGRLHICDVGSISDVVKHVDGIATDPPYGRSSSTNGEPVPDLIRRAFGSLSKIMDAGSRLVMVMHDPALADCAEDFELIESHELWVHRSLTRHFCVFVRR